MELQSTHPERTGIPDPSDHPTQPTVPRVTERPDISLQSSETSSKPSALHQTLNKTPIAPAATEALSRPLQRAGALGGSYSEELEVRALQRERRRTVLITLSLILLLGGGVAFWWISQDTPAVATEAAVASEVRAGESKAELPEENAVEPAPEEVPVAEEEAPAEAAQEEGDGSTAQAQDDTAKPSEATAIEQQEAEEQRQAAETAREVAAAAVDEELESGANLPEEKPAAAKKTKKKTPKPGNAASPSKGYASLMRAAKKLKRKQPSKALDLYKQALAQRPSSVDALSNVGRLQLKSGKTSAAIKTFTRCRKAMPRYTPCMYWHGRSLEKAGRRSDAEKAYEKYLDVNPDGSQAIDVRRRLSR
jgi:tetratricopeptide (TPR) repeat protein